MRNLSWSSLGGIVRAPLFWLAGLYLLVGVVYACVTPMLEKPDESDHYGYIRYLREHRALPPLITSADWMQESLQPPLYYAVVTALTCWLPDDPDLYSLLALNPYISASVPGHRNDNRNLFLHPPYMTPLVLAGRLVSLLFGLGSVIASYHLAAQLFPERSVVPAATAAVVGFHPKFLYMATAVNNDAAIAFFGTLVIAILMYRLQKGDFPYFAVLLGGILGLASITKVSGLVFFPLTCLALLFVYGGLRPAVLRDAVIIVLVSLLVAGWWYVRNALLYSDPLTVGTHTLHSAGTRVLWERIGYDLSSIEYTFWANEARTFISPIRLDQILIWWGRTSLGLLALGLLFNYHSIQTNKPALVVLLSWPITFLFLLVLYWNRAFSWPFGRLLLPAIAPMALLFILGWQYTFPSCWRRPVLVFSAGVVVVIGTLVPFVSLYPLFNPSREWQAQQVEHSVGTIYVDSETGGQIARLVGYNLLEPYAFPGIYFPLELCWEPLGQTEVPYAVFVQLLDLSQLSVHDSPAVWGRRETYPGLGNRPTDRWRLHRVFCDKVLVWVDPEVPTPLGAVIEVGFLDPETGRRLGTVNAQGETVSLAFVGSVPILSPEDLPTIDVQPVDYVLGNGIGLDQVQFSDALESSVTLTLTWQSLQPVPYNATTFIHLMGANGRLLSQVDRQPLNGRFPTSYWIPGQTITDVVTLSLSSDVCEGPLVLNLGMYTWPSLERLPVVDASGVIQPDNVIVIDEP